MPIGDRVVTLGALAFVAGLVAWYAAAASAIDLLLSATSLASGAGVLGLAVGLGALVAQGGARKAFSNAVFAAAGVAFAAFTLAALVNQLADGSATRAEAATLLEFYEPTKGPPMVRLTWRGDRFSIQATHAEGCAKGSAVTVEIRGGALGAPWIERVACEATR